MMHVINLKLQYSTHTETLPFFVINLGTDNMILGYTFLNATNPRIDVTVSTEDAHLWTPKRQLYNLDREARDAQNDYGNPNSNFIPSNARDYITVPPYFARCTTMATQLAVKAMDKGVKTWQQQVPKQYHTYGKVFSEEEAQRFPDSRPWDHAINLLPDTPETLAKSIH
jgi:hypothetical protein